MSFASPFLLWGLLLIPVLLIAYWLALRTSTCSPTSSTRHQGGGGTCRRCSRSPHWPH